LVKEGSMTKEELLAFAREVMGRADMVVLATNGPEGYPLQRALFNLRDEGRFPSLAAYQRDKGLAVYLGTNTASTKVRRIGEDPLVSVYYMIPAEYKGLCLSGAAVPDPEARAAMWVEGWEMYYPKGREDPDYTVLRLDPARARGWTSSSAFDIEL
jgi:general stress protein 26